MRIASLVPSATEMLFALGLGDSVVAVTHECDYPPAATELSQLTRSVIEPGLSSAEIDRAVKERTARGEALYELDENTLGRLQPDLIVTQALCAVCAVSFDDVRAVAGRLQSRPRVVSLDPMTLGEVISNIKTLAEAAGAAEAGDLLTESLGDRIDAVTGLVQDSPRPRVAALEWLDPPYAAGHWVPQMIDLAGAEEVLGMPGESSQMVSWEQIQAEQPEVVVSIPCGYHTSACAQEARAHAANLQAIAPRQVLCLDAASYFSRPGPRLVDGIELLAGVLHPGLGRQPSPEEVIELPELANSQA